MHYSKQKKGGFTLVEIMIVVLIIGLLAAMAYPAFMKVKTHAQASRVANDFRSFAGLFEAYTLDNGTYPADASPGAFARQNRAGSWSLRWSGRGPPARRLAFSRP